MTASGGSVSLSSGTAPLEVSDFAAVSGVAAAVMRRVGVQHFAPAPGERNADDVVAVDFGREVGDHQTLRVAIVALSHPGEHAAVAVVGHEPFEARTDCCPARAARAASGRAC